MSEMKLVWKKHKINMQKQREQNNDGEEVQKKDDINWNQVMAYFKGKLVGIMGQHRAISDPHMKALQAAAKLFETQMACFVKAYRD